MSTQSGAQPIPTPRVGNVILSVPVIYNHSGGPPTNIVWEMPAEEQRRLVPAGKVIPEYSCVVRASEIVTSAQQGDTT